MQAFDHWKLLEEAGGLLVLSGIIGQVWAEVHEPDQEQIGETSGVALGLGLVLSLAFLVGSGDPVSSAIASVIGGVQ